jgi:hypothetical protein
MEAMIGARAECGIRHQIREVINKDYKSQYPTINRSYSRRSSLSRLRGFWDLGAHGFVWLFHRLMADTFANALEG